MKGAKLVKTVKGDYGKAKIYRAETDFFFRLFAGIASAGLSELVRSGDYAVYIDDSFDNSYGTYDEALEAAKDKVGYRER